jgi:hypothetical protein
MLTKRSLLHWKGQNVQILPSDASRQRLDTLFIILLLTRMHDNMMKSAYEKKCTYERERVSNEEI